MTVQPMIKLRRLRADRRQQLDPQFGPVLLFGIGRAAGRGVPGPRAGAAAAQHDAGAADDGADEDLHGAQGRARPHAGRSGRARGAAGALQPAGGRSSRWIKEIDINPLLASPEGLIALDARVVLHPGPVASETTCRGLRSGRTRHKYVGDVDLKDGETVTIRPIRPEDEPLMVRFHETLSEQTVYLRYFHRFTEPADCARAADTDLLHRLRPPDRAGRRRRAGDRHAGDHRCWEVDQITCD